MPEILVLYVDGTDIADPSTADDHPPAMRIVRLGNAFAGGNGMNDSRVQIHACNDVTAWSSPDGASVPTPGGYLEFNRPVAL